MVAEYEGKESAEEISQLLYHIQVMMISCRSYSGRHS